VDYAANELVPIAFGATKPEYDAQSVESLRMPVGEGIAGWAALTGEAQVVDNTVAHQHSLPVPGTPEIDESMLVAPMQRDQRVLGVLTLSKLGLRQYSAEHLRVLRIFADQAATAIANAQLYESERQRAEKLRELDQLRKDFVSTITHELRTPLTAILGYTETLLNFWERLDLERQQDMVRRIHLSTSRLDRLVKDLLVATRVDAGALSLNPGVVDLAVQVQQAVTEIATKFGGLTIVQRAPEEPMFVFADAHRVQQVLVNLLDNAAKYSPEDNVITVSWRQEDGCAVVCVADRGIGIAPEDLPRLFTRFGKIAQVARQGHVGTGLGLYISRQLVEAMGGEIWVNSTPAVGSTFCFRLPLAH
jgi:signal transduction histidine kinase